MSDRPIVIVVASLGAGGMERNAAMLADLFSRVGSVLLLTFEPAPADHYAVNPQVRRVRVPYYWDTTGHLDQAWSTLRRWWKLRRALGAARPRCIISFGDTTNLRVLLSCIGTGVPVVISERSDPRQYAIPSAWQWLRRRLYPRAAAVVVQTPTVAQWAAQLGDPARVHVIPNPVRPAPAPGPRPYRLPSTRIVLGVGRLSLEKGFDLLLRAFAASRLAGHGWSLVVLGDGPDRSSLLGLAKELDIAGAVHLPGIVDNPEAFMQHAEMFVLPSRYEGFPNALLEAMACGTACIAFDCPSGPADIIRHGETGLLVTADNVDELAATIGRVACDDQGRRAMGSLAMRDVASRFDPQAVFSRWEQLTSDVTKPA